MLGGFRKHGNQKIAYALDKYYEEAGKIIDEEKDLVRKGVYPDMLPPPRPLSVAQESIRYFMPACKSDARPGLPPGLDNADRYARHILLKASQRDMTRLRRWLLSIKKLVLTILLRMHARRLIRFILALWRSMTLDRRHKGL